MPRTSLLVAVLMMPPALVLGQTVGQGPAVSYYKSGLGSSGSCTATACTFTVPVLLPIGTNVAPALAYSAQTGTGIYFANTSIKFTLNGNAQLSLDTNVLYPTTSDVASLGGNANLWTNLYLTRSIQGSKSKTLTDAAGAVSFVRIAVPTNGAIGGRVQWVATSTDGASMLATSGEEFFAGVDKAGTVTCGVGAALGTATAYSVGQTLVCTVTAATSTTNCDLQVTCTNNTAGDQAPVFNYRLDMPIIATVTPL
jgi:hypothetical protein